MDIPILVAIVLSVLIVVYLIFTSLQKPSTPSDVDQAEPRQEQQPAIRGRAAAAIGGRRGLQRMTGVRHRTTSQDAPDSDDENQEDEDEEPKKKIGKKKMAKLQAKEEKKQQRQADEELREQRRQKEEKLMEEQKAKDMQREEEEKARELEEQKKREEKAKKEEEEYREWKKMMSVEGSGTVTQEQQEREKRMDEFINLVKQNKVVLLEDLAAEFNMKTMEAKEQLEKLDKEGKISGLIDDRGKFIYVSREEMEKVASFINRKGRVSIEDIARESNKLINLNTNSED